MLDLHRFEEATYRTTRWIDRCIKAHSRPHEQNLFAIVQGGLDARLRAISITQLSERSLPGYAIGGLAGGEDKDQFWRCTLRYSLHLQNIMMNYYWCQAPRFGCQHGLDEMLFVWL